MMTVKQEAIRAISSLPDDAPIDDVMYRLYVIDKVSRGQAALKEGRTITTEELLKEIESW
jgi:predicted transcriptional regulator